MPMVTPTLNLPQPPVSSSGAARTGGVTPPPAPAASTVAPAKMPDAMPSTTVTLSPQAMSLAAGHPASASAAAGEPLPGAAPAAAAHGASVYESLKSGISTGVADVGDAIADGAHAVVDGVETTLSVANKVATGILELPFAVVSKGCDAVGSLIDKL